ncbi:MAG: hypothetical protein DI529_08025 [Chryseobacterium sp.]|nr:MAG: hypothetical protein DI529_08025 [Chryseobacterium sp.]
MKKSILFLILILSQMSFAQVSYEKTKLVKDGQKYNLSKYRQVFTNPQAIDYIKKGRTNKTFADIFAFSGGFGIGFGLVGALISPNEKTFSTPYGAGTVKYDKSGYWTVFGVGAGLALISIPFHLGAEKNIKKAVEVENGGSDVAFQPYFKIESAGNGIAMSYNF